MKGKFKVAVEKYANKIHDEVSNGKRINSYSSIRRFGDHNFALVKGSESFEINSPQKPFK